MADGSRLFPRAPVAVIERLQEREAAQRAETKRRGLPAEPVCVEGLLLLQRNFCGCGCGNPLDFEAVWSAKDTPPGFPIVAHRLARGSRGGHVVGNVFIDRDACNKRDAGPDTSGAASVRRFTPDHSKKLDREKRGGSSIKGAGRMGQPAVSALSSKRRPDNYLSPLSKEYRRKMKERVEAK